MSDKETVSGKQYIYAFTSGKLVLLVSIVLALMAFSMMFGIRLERYQSVGLAANNGKMAEAPITIQPPPVAALKEVETEEPAEAEPAVPVLAEQTPPETPKGEPKPVVAPPPRPVPVSMPVAEEVKPKVAEVVKKEASPPPAPAPVVEKKIIQPASTATKARTLIQVSSSQDKNLATTQVNTLKSKGFPAFIEETVVAGKGKFYRVLIGPYKSESEAAGSLAQLKKDSSFAGSYVRSLP